MELTLAIIGIVVSLIAIALGWSEIKKYVPFLPQPLIQIDYQENVNAKYTSIGLRNIGNAKANYLTADIKSKNLNETFSVKRVSGHFDIKTSGLGGNWIIISAKDILPQEYGFVDLYSESSPVTLEPPKIKSDSRYKFAGKIRMTLGKTRNNHPPPVA